MRDRTGGPSGLVGIPSFSIGAFSFAGPLAKYYLVLAVLIVVLVLLLLGGHAIRLRPRAQSHSHRSDGGRRAGHQRAALQSGRVCDQRRARVAVRQPLAFDFQFLSPDMVSTLSVRWK